MVALLWHGNDPFLSAPEGHTPDYHGWNSNHPYLSRAIDDLKPRVAVEIGVWKGLSVLAMAERMRDMGVDGVVIAIDTFLGSSEHWLQRKWFERLPFRNGHPALFETFVANVFERGLQDYVLPLPMDAANAAMIFEALKINVDLIHLDAAHDFTSVSADLARWWPLLREGGVLLGDDYFPNGQHWPGVRDAFRTFFQSGDLENDGGKCWVRKEGTAAKPAAPRVSVVMTVYNDLRFLDEAVASILEQTFRDLELIIVDDGTGENELFQALARRDPRIRVIVNPVNLGTAEAANRGIRAARAPIIARQDADDVAEPARIARLVAALDEDPQLGLVGSSVTFIDEDGNPLGLARMPESDLDIRWTILFHNPFYHSSVAFRRECFDAAGGYRPEELVSQDHYLWFQMLPSCRARNIAEPLTRYRLNPRGLTIMNAKDARRRTHAIREALWARIGLTYDLHDNGLARDITDFLRGSSAPPDRRMAAYVKLLTVLRAFLAAPRAGMPSNDAQSRTELASSLAGRILAAPPPGRRNRLTLAWMCWQVAPAATLKAVGRLAVMMGKAANRT